MIVEEISFSSLIAISASPIPTTIHRYKNVYFALSHVANKLYIAIAKDAPKEKKPYIEYDTITRKWRFVDPATEKFTRDPRAVILTIVDVKKLAGKVGEEIKSLLSR